jgi:hypothetical protein
MGEAVAKTRLVAGAGDGIITRSHRRGKPMGISKTSLFTRRFEAGAAWMLARRRRQRII